MADKRFENRSVWLGMSIGGALAIVIGVLWFIFSIADLVLGTPLQPWVAALVIVILGVIAVIIGDTALMRQELK